MNWWEALILVFVGWCMGCIGGQEASITVAEKRDAGE